jgi:hypothetical protein
MARTLGMTAAPDRPRFLAEIVRVVYDTREGKSVEADARVAQLTKHLDVVARFQSSLAAIQPGGAGVTLAMATAKTDRNRLKDFLDLLGLKLREKNKSFTVERTDSKQAAERLRELADLGIDPGRLATRLNAGEIVLIQVPTETVPIPLSAKLWSEAIFQRPVAAAALFGTIMSDRRAALVAHGLAALDDETLKFLSENPAVLTRLYEHDAAGFAASGDALRIREGRVVVPGGADGVRAWEAVLDERVTRPDRFVRELFGASQGRVALVYQTLSQLDQPRVRFALGSWMPDPAMRTERFKALVNAAGGRDEFNIDLRPFGRPIYDVSTLLMRVRVRPDGALASPAPRLFWQRAFESADVPDDPERRLRNLQEDGVADAAWLAEHICMADVRVRAERLDQLTFAQRAFADAPEADLPSELVAVRSFPRFRMLMLTLDRMGIHRPSVYAAATRQADKLAALDGRRRFVAVGSYQAALALVARLVRVHNLNTAAAGPLVNSLTAIALNAEGEYAGGISRWIERELGPALKWPAKPDVDDVLVRSLAGAMDPSAAATKVAWEGRTYRVDLVIPEQQRLTRARERMGSPGLRGAIDLEHEATRLTDPSVSVAAIRAAMGELKVIASAIPPLEKGAVIVPPGLNPPKSARDILNKAIQDLSKINQPKDTKKAARAAEPLFGLSDERLTEALMSLTYALDIGNPEGTTLMGGDVSQRHDFGFDIKIGELRTRAAWAEPRQIAASGAPWHVSGSLLGLDAGLSQLGLRRIDTGEVPPMPTLTMPDRETFTRTIALINPFELTDAARDAIVDGIHRGRARVAALASNPSDRDEAMDQIKMDGWRRRAARWAIANDPQAVPSFFSLAELLNLGAGPQDAGIDHWGMASDASDACLCTTAPAPGRAAILVGRPQLGLLPTQVADVNLHIAELLSELHLPAVLLRGVLASAVQEYVDQVRPLHANDWLTLVRAGQAISKDRVEDYVSALTAGGPLVAERTSAGGDRVPQ